MKKSIFRATLAATALLLSTTLVSAAEVTVKVPDVKGDAKATVDKTKAGAKATTDKSKAAAAGAQKTVTDTKAGAKAAVVDTKAGAKAAVTDTKASAKAAVATPKAAVTKPALIDINSATEAELKSVPGVGDAYAAKIIAGRPYANKTQLKTRNVLPAPVYESVKNQIVAKQAAKSTTPAKKK